MRNSHGLEQDGVHRDIATQSLHDLKRDCYLSWRASQVGESQVLLIRTLLLSLVFTLTVASDALACFAMAYRHLADIRHADLVVQGDIVNYQKIGFGGQRPLEHYGLIRLRVSEVLVGETTGEIELYWWNSTFGIPEDWPYGRKIVIAAIDPQKPQPPLRGPSATVRGSVRPDLLSVLQAPCALPFIFGIEPSAKELRNYRKHFRSFTALNLRARHLGEWAAIRAVIGAHPKVSRLREVGVLRSCLMDIHNCPEPPSKERL